MTDRRHSSRQLCHHLSREPMADGRLDNSIAILIPSFKLRQDDSVLAEHKVTGKAIYSKRAAHRVVAIVDLAPIHSVAVNKLLPLLLRVIFINTNNDDFFRVDAGGHRFQQWQRYTAGRTPCTPEVQHDYLTLERIQTDFFTATERGRELRSKVFAHPAGIINEPLDLALSRRARELGNHSFQHLNAL